MQNSNDVVNIEKETWQMVYDFWKSRHSTMSEEERTWRKNEFKKFSMEYDTRRKKNFHDTFPELATWI